MIFKIVSRENGQISFFDQDIDISAIAEIRLDHNKLYNKNGSFKKWCSRYTLHFKNGEFKNLSYFSKNDIKDAGAKMILKREYKNFEYKNNKSRIAIDKIWEIK